MFLYLGQLYIISQYMLRTLFAVAALCLLLGCSGNKREATKASPRAFYYWQTSTQKFPWGDPVYEALHVGRLYVRFFDVDWNDEVQTPVPVSPVELYDFMWNDSVNVVPVVFITNETFSHLDTAGVSSLARQVHRKMYAQLHTILDHRARASFDDPQYWWEPGPYQQRSRHFNELEKRDSAFAALVATVREVQFDCDWTPTTRDKYFMFLRKMKQLFPGQLVSSTIRLYQYKYPRKAGVPPVDRGMLMCYNAGNVKETEARNSIFDHDEVMSYLKGAEPYPVKLDYALPVFGWAVLHRQGAFKGILPTTTLRKEYNEHLTDVRNGLAEVKEDFVFGHTSESIYLRKGDAIRFEQPNLNDVAQVAEWLSHHKNTNDAVLTFYHLNEDDLHAYSKALEAMYSAF